MLNFFRKLFLFKVVIALISTNGLLSNSLKIEPNQPFPKAISIPAHHHYSIDLSSCYSSDSSLLINGRESSSLQSIRSLQFPQIPNIMELKMPTFSDDEWDSSNPLLMLTKDKYLYWSYLPSEETDSPLTPNSIQFETNNKVVCFDAIALSKDLVAIDCSLLERGVRVSSDLIYYVSLITKQVQTVNVPEISLVTIGDGSRRKMKYFNFGERALLYRWVEESPNQNALIQILDVTNPFNPTFFANIDRNLLNLTTFVVASVSFYNGDIFVTDSQRVFRINNYAQTFKNTKVSVLSINDLVPGSTISKISALKDIHFGEVTLSVLLYTLSSNGAEVQRIDWSVFDAPSVIETFTVSSATDFNNIPSLLTLSQDFLFIIQASKDIVEPKFTLQVYRRGKQTGEENLLYITQEYGSNYLFSVDRIQNKVLTYDVSQSKLVISSLAYHHLILSSSKPANFTATFQSANKPLCNFALNIVVTDADSQDLSAILYPQAIESIRGDPQTIQLNSILSEKALSSYLDQNGIDTSMFGEDLAEISINSNERVLAIQKESPNSFVLYSQEKTSQTLFSNTCTLQTDSSKVDCSPKALFSIAGAINFFEDTPSFIAFTTEGNPENVFFFDKTTDSLTPLQLPSNAACKSLKVMSSTTDTYLFCVSDHNIMSWETKDLNSNKYFVINSHTLGLSFNPLDISTFSQYPDLLFIKVSNGVIIADIGPFNPNKVAFVGIVDISTDLAQNQDFTFVINEGKLTIFLENQKKTLQYSLENIRKPYLQNDCYNCHTLENFKTQGSIGVSESPLFILLFSDSSTSHASVYNVLMPGFMQIFSSFSLPDKSSNILGMYNYDVLSDLVFLYMPEMQAISVRRVYYNPIVRVRPDTLLQKSQMINPQIFAGGDQRLQLNLGLNAGIPAAKSEQPPTRQYGDKSGFTVLMGPQSYSPVGFTLFIIAIAYIVIIFICIVRRVIKSRRRQRITDAQSGIILPEEEAEPPRQQGLAEPLNNIPEVADSSEEASDNTTRYVAINDSNNSSGLDGNRNR